MNAFLHDISWVMPLRAPWAHPVWEAFSALGYLPFFLLALPLVYWLWDKDTGTRLTVLIVLNAIVNSFMKDLFQDPRPPMAFALDPRPGTSFGMPSGHAQVATAMWFWAAYEFRRLWAWPIAALIVAGVCFSRLYLGVHDIEDVLWGIVLGLSSLVIYRAAVAGRFRQWHDLHPGWQMAIILALHPVLYILWPGERGPLGVVGLGAFLAGWWLGVIYDRHRLAFQRHPDWRLALIAAIIGCVGMVLVVRQIEPALLSIGIVKPGAAWLQALIVALYVTVLAPWMFRQARLSR